MHGYVLCGTGAACLPAYFTEWAEWESVAGTKYYD